MRGAAGRHPGDVWVNHALAGALDRLRPPAHEESVRYYTAARALRPEAAHDLAHLLERMGRGVEAEAVFRDLAKRRPEDAHHLACLATHLKGRGRAADAAPILDRAAAAARAAIRLRPDDVNSHGNLGLVLDAQGKVDEAIAAYRTAIRLRPDYAEVHNNLGNALEDQGKVDEALAAYRAAIRLQPDLVEAHYNLGGVVAAQGKMDEAVAEFRTAIRLRPDYAKAHNNLGNALQARGKLDEAVAACRARPSGSSPTTPWPTTTSATP